VVGREQVAARASNTDGSVAAAAAPATKMHRALLVKMC